MYGCWFQQIAVTHSISSWWNLIFSGNAQIKNLTKYDLIESRQTIQEISLEKTQNKSNRNFFATLAITASEVTQNKPRYLFIESRVNKWWNLIWIGT